jgi:hypothetical protein
LRGTVNRSLAYSHHWHKNTLGNIVAEEELNGAGAFLHIWKEPLFTKLIVPILIPRIVILDAPYLTVISFLDYFEEEISLLLEGVGSIGYIYESMTSTNRDGVRPSFGSRALKVSETLKSFVYDDEVEVVKSFVYDDGVDHLRGLLIFKEILS